MIGLFHKRILLVYFADGVAGNSNYVLCSPTADEWQNERLMPVRRKEPCGGILAWYICFDISVKRARLGWFTVTTMDSFKPWTIPKSWSDNQIHQGRFLALGPFMPSILLSFFLVFQGEAKQLNSSINADRLRMAFYFHSAILQV